MFDLKVKMLCRKDGDLGLIVDKNVETACSKDEVGTNELGGCLAGVDQSTIVELGLRKTEPNVTVSSVTSGKLV